ncbi:MAG: hypothetical protein PHX83_11785 [Acidobacteriia bacterium]|nr:hypothetical protein [Terriglobia bacterium]
MGVEHRGLIALSQPHHQILIATVLDAVELPTFRPLASKSHNPGTARRPAKSREPGCCWIGACHFVLDRYVVSLTTTALNFCKLC